ncbi:copper resistance CopC family protein [Thermaerobacter subterraneus]|uniref:Uncharacterized protein, copper resistance protein CopC-like protein n=1 Tax=Thermaerobacter subterraneus DSM 13965 TaxID=867903 RepID=K6Q1R9_9FIRM|nr:copper resistance CopC family protein [Thermaerobacter subterraneus]EKP95113.1 uncharacterized protein, copper resistance protein CopC-like protein [Thermaerobacter subterraneus DSM 13965]
MNWRRLVRTAFLASLLGGVLAVVLVASGAGGWTPAEAHAALVGSFPEPGAQLQEAPRKIELIFTEAVEPEFGELTLTRQGGGTVELGPMEAEGETLRAEVRGSMPAGQYVLHYKVLSQDGHPVEGDVTFSVVAAAPSPGSGTADQQPAPPAPGQDEPGGATTPPAGAEPAPAQDGGSQAWLWAAVVALVAVVAVGLMTVLRRPR